MGDQQQPIWEATAAGLDLFHQAGSVAKSPVIYGTIDGFSVKVTCTDDREGHPPARTIYSVTYPSLGGPIRVGRERSIRRVGVLRRLIPVNDVEIGDKAFDKLAIIDAADVETAVAFLTESRRDIITTLLGSRRLRNVLVSETSTSFDTKAIEDKPDRLAGNILGSVQLARLLSHTPDGETPATPPLRSFFDEDQFTTSAIQDGRP